MKATTTTGFNPWPYSIIGFFALAIVAVVVWVSFCVGHGSDLVAADYYEQEVEYQDQLDRMERGQTLGERASITYDVALGFIRIQVPPEQVALKAAGAIHLYRPSEADLDRTLPLEVNAAGEQRLDVQSLKPGLWEVRVRWAVEGQEFFLNEKLNIGTGDL